MWKNLVVLAGIYFMSVTVVAQPADNWQSVLAEATTYEATLKKPIRFQDLAELWAFFEARDVKFAKKLPPNYQDYAPIYHTIAKFTPEIAMDHWEGRVLRIRGPADVFKKLERAHIDESFTHGLDRRRRDLDLSWTWRPLRALAKADGSSEGLASQALSRSLRIPADPYGGAKAVWSKPSPRRL